MDVVKIRFSFYRIFLVYKFNRYYFYFKYEVNQN